MIVATIMGLHLHIYVGNASKKHGHGTISKIVGCVTGDMTFKQVLKYPGSKWGMTWIVKHFPEHHTYVSPYFGSGADFFLKSPASYEVINDRSGSIVNLFQVVRERGQDLAELVDL